MIVTADLFDQYPDHLAVCEAQFRSFGRRRSLFGECATLKVFEAHTPVLEVLKTAGNGRILVVDAGGSLRVGVLGDRLAAIGLENGWAGAVIFGAVRDTVGIDALDFGVKALGATARRDLSKVHGAFSVPIAFGGCRFAPGDWIYADVDAVMVSKSKLLLNTA